MNSTENRFSITRLLFDEPISIMPTYRIEVDMQRRKASVTNKVGKVVAVVSFHVESSDGQSTSTGH